MTTHRIRVFVTGATLLFIGVCAENGFSGDKQQAADNPVDTAIHKGLKWLVSTQGRDGGWGQDGGETSYVRQGERLESNGNDVANTAVVAEALLHTGTTATRGEYREPLQRAVDFILKHVEQSAAGGLAITDLNGTQIERKLGPFIDTFMTAKLLAELDGAMGTAQANTRVRTNLQKCVAKIEKNQLQDGSWNIAGGWAPILGTSMASQGLAIAQAKHAANPQVALDRVKQYTMAAAAPAPTKAAAGVAGGVPGGVVGGVVGSSASTVAVTGAADRPAFAASAGIPLYQEAQELEQISRSDDDRKKHAARISTITDKLASNTYVTGFGSIGGEEFFSWLNISESLHRTGGSAWEKWNGDMKAKLLKLQNQDGTWAGQHCITGRVAVTGAAILLLTADREPAPITQASARKR